MTNTTASPVILGVRFNGRADQGNSQVVVYWQPAEGSGSEFRLKLYQDDKEILSADPIGVRGTLNTTNVNFSLASLYTVRVMEKTGSTFGPPSDPVQVIWTRPDELAIAYDGTTITANWKMAAGIATTTGGEILLYNGADLVQASGAEGLSGSLTPSPALVATDTYSIAVCATYGVSVGPPCDPVEVIQVRPTIAKLNYNEGTIQVTAIPLMAPFLGASLYMAGELVQTYLGSGVFLTFKPSAPLQPWHTYTVQLWAAQTDQNGAPTIISTGPASGPVAVVVAAPEIEAADFTDGQNIELTWRNGPGLEFISGGLIMLLENGTIKQSASADGTSGTITPSPPLGPGDQRTLRVASTRWMSTGPTSPDVTVLAARPSVSRLSYDGGILSVAWDAVADGAATYVVGVFAGGALLASQPAAGASASVPVVLDPSVGYSVAVKAVNGEVVGPFGTTQAAISAAPTVASVTTGSGTASVTLTPPDNTSGIGGYQAWLVEEGLPVGRPTDAVDLTATINYNFKPGYSYGVIARAVGAEPAKLTGPWNAHPGAGAPLLVTQASGVTATYDKQRVTVRWEPASDGRVDGYVVALAVSDQTPATQRVAQPYCEFQLAQPPAGATASVTVTAVAGSSTGYASAPLGLVLREPTINAAAFDGSTLSLGWSAVTDAGVNGYVVSLFNGGAATQQAAFGGTSGTMSAPPGPFAIRVQAVGDHVTGPLSEPVALLSAAPHLKSSGFDAASGNYSLAWDAVPGAGGYSVEVLGTAIAEKSAATTFSLTPDKFPAAGVYGVRVRAIATPTDDAIAGPWSSPATLLLIQPGGVAVQYDGQQARVSWEPVASPLVVAYLVTVLGGDAPITAWTATNSAVVAVPFDAAKQFNVLVQALTRDATGRPTAPSGLFQSGFYLSTDKSKAPHLCPASAPAMSSQDIVVYLPELFTTPVSGEDLPTAPPFVFGVSAQQPYAYTLTMSADSIVWTFSAEPVRANVKDAYTKLVEDLTTLHITPLGWRVVQDAIARAMPQTFLESLFYGYGFAPSDGYIDLKPGMVLRVEYESYQYIGPNQSDSLYLNGFVGANTAEYEIGSYVDANGKWLTGLDAFLSLVTQSGTRVLPPQTSQEKSGGGGGIVDFYFSQFRLPFMRLVYPPNLFSASTAGTAYAAYNVAVLAAPDYVTLNAATGNLRNGEPLVSGAAATYLRGRTMVSACTRVWLDGQPCVVPVGTTAGSLLETMASRPPSLDRLVLQDLRLTRTTGYAVTQPSASSYAVGGGYPVQLNWAGSSSHDAALDWLSLPLLLGDRLEAKERPAT